MMGSGMKRLDRQHRLQNHIHCLPAADAVSFARVLPRHHRQPGPRVQIIWKLLDDRLQPFKPSLAPGLAVGLLLVLAPKRIQIEPLPVA